MWCCPVQAGIAELAVAVNLHLATMANTRPRGADILSISSSCTARSRAGNDPVGTGMTPFVGAFSVSSGPPGARLPSPPAGPFGLCSAVLTRSEAVKMWGSLFHVTPRAIFSSASMPEAARPGGALGKSLVASDAAMKRAAAAFRKFLVPQWGAQDLFPRDVLSDKEIDAVVFSALLATFGAPGVSQAEAWRGGSPAPLPLAAVSGVPAMVVEESYRRSHDDLALSPTGGYASLTPKRVQKAASELSRLRDMNLV
jgi:hypothetical protein